MQGVGQLLGKVVGGGGVVVVEASRQVLLGHGEQVVDDARAKRVEHVLPRVLDRGLTRGSLPSNSEQVLIRKQPRHKVVVVDELRERDLLAVYIYF